MVYVGASEFIEDKRIRTGLDTCCLVLAKERDASSGESINGAHAVVPESLKKSYLNINSEYKGPIISVKDAFENILRNYESKGIDKKRLKFLVAGCKGDEYIGKMNYLEAFSVLSEKELYLDLSHQLAGLPCKINISADSGLVKALLYFEDKTDELDFYW